MLFYKSCIFSFLFPPHTFSPRIHTLDQMHCADLSPRHNDANTQYSKSVFKCMKRYAHESCVKGMHLMVQGTTAKNTSIMKNIPFNNWTGGKESDTWCCFAFHFKIMANSKTNRTEGQGTHKMLLQCALTRMMHKKCVDTYGLDRSLDCAASTNTRILFLVMNIGNLISH